MTFELFTHGARHGIDIPGIPGIGTVLVDVAVALLLINVGARPPEPVGPWHPAHPF